MPERKLHITAMQLESSIHTGGRFSNTCARSALRRITVGPAKTSVRMPITCRYIGSDMS